MTNEQRIEILEKKLDALLENKNIPSNCVVRSMDNAGRIVIPKAFRDSLNADATSQFEIFLKDNCICLRKK